MNPVVRAVLNCVWIGLVAVAVVALRILGLKSPSFQAVAHLYVGGLFGAWLEAGRPARPLLWLALLVTAVEVACFLHDLGR